MTFLVMIFIFIYCCLNCVSLDDVTTLIMTFNFGILITMVVCLCQGVSEKDVREAIANGATTRKKVTRACGAGAGCEGESRGRGHCTIY